MIKHHLVRYLCPTSLALLAFAGFCILYKYLYYLNNNVDPLNFDQNNFIWPHTKLMIFFWWLLVVLSCLRAAEKHLSRKGKKIRLSIALRSILAGLVFCTSVTALDPPNLQSVPFASPPFYYYSIELAPYFFINTIAYSMLFFAFFSLSSVERYLVLLGRYVLHSLRWPVFYWIALAFMWIFLLAYHVSGVFFGHLPWIYDTIVQLIHAKFILAGRLYGLSPPEPLRDFFSIIFMINDGKWYSQYPLGHILMLAVGTAFHHPEMVNPFLGASTCIAVYLLAKEIYGKHVAKIAVILSALCSYLIILSSEYMNNATSLLTGTLFLWAYFRVLNQRGWPYALIAGTMLGYCFITRPYSAFALALPAGFYALYLIITNRRAYLVPMVVIAGVFSCFVLFQLYYNSVTTGDALTFAYELTWGPGHNPFNQEAIEKLTSEKLYINLQTNLQRLIYFNRILFEWPLPAMALVALVLALRGSRRDEQLLFATILSMFISVQFVLNRDIAWGPRLVYEINGILLVLCAKGISMVPPLLRKVSPHRHRLAYYYGSGICILVSFYAFSFQYNFKKQPIKEFYAFYNQECDPVFYNKIIQHVTPPALVFVPVDEFVFVAFTNPPQKENPVIFAMDWGKMNGDLMKYMPRRSVYRVLGDSSNLKITKIREPTQKP